MPDTDNQRETPKTDFTTITEAANALAAEATSMGLDGDVFGESVYGAAIDQEGEIETAESVADRINNTGFAGQIEFLLAGYAGLVDGVAAVRAIMAETP